MTHTNHIGRTPTTAALSTTMTKIQIICVLVRGPSICTIQVHTCFCYPIPSPFTSAIVHLRYRPPPLPSRRRSCWQTGTTWDDRSPSFSVHDVMSPGPAGGLPPRHPPRPLLPSLPQAHGSSHNASSSTSTEASKTPGTTSRSTAGAVATPRKY